MKLCRLSVNNTAYTSTEVTSTIEITFCSELKFIMYLYKTIGVHLNVSQEVNENVDFLLTANHLKQWEQVNGPLPNNCVILVNFGWAHKFSNRKLYYNNGTDDSSFVRYDIK